MQSLCNEWEFTTAWNEDFLNWITPAEAVRLPHTCRELSLHSIDPADYEMLCGYRRELTLSPEWEGKRLFLQFDGAAHIATVYVNGQQAVTHRCGYTAFRVEITPLAIFDRPNRIAVKLDTSENPTIPPFGYVIDYLTYGGLYREVWLDVREQGRIDDIFVYTPELHTAQIQVTLDGAPSKSRVEVSILDSLGQTVWNGTAAQGAVTASVPQAHPWNCKHPVRYTCRAVLLDAEDSILDVQETLFGFRTAQFRTDGFYLNGEKVFLRGLNRHQSFPYVGYAAPERLQREDARILQEELGCNAVRTSHYPQSHWFLDECDRRGLLVFTELPGWQHIGDDAWKDQAVENVREMVLQYRNHPSIILWGVRINESQDDDPFYTRTNAIAHQLDPSRQTSGVRYLEKSHLLEDVYAYNDFSHTGKNAGARRKADVTPDPAKALLISECNGHMFPTKPYDTWDRRQEQALRHIRVQNAALREHAGCFGWCMFDYPTHKDFGSGDRICYHGVMDAFRNPKLAAAAYRSQTDATPVLEVGSSMDIGDYPGGQIGKTYVFSNADEIALYKNGLFVTNLSRSPWRDLPHPPFVVDDTIGTLLETQEGFSKKKAALIRVCLLAAGTQGLSGLPLKYRLKLLWCMVRYHMTFDDVVALHSKYVSNWGGSSTVWRFDAKKEGQIVGSVTRSPCTRLHLEVLPSHTVLTEKYSYDMAAVRVRILDENGAAAPYVQPPVTFSVQGPLALVGPDVVTAEGGACGCYLRTSGTTGHAALTVSAPQTEPVTMEFVINTEAENIRN